jgi:Carboxypeptidase regulatory-like domain
MRRLAKVFLTVAALLVLMPAALFAQEGQIAGTVRDTSDALVPGVTVEVTSPALIERIRSATTDGNGQYRITNLPVGVYKVTFSLSGFTKQERDGVVLSSGFTAPINATMSVGQITEIVVVSATAAIVDVQNSREVINLPGEQIRNMPTSRNANSLLELTPGISSQYKPTTSQTPFGAPGVCVGGIGVFCSPNMAGFNVGDAGTALDQSNLAQGRVLVDGQVVNSGGTVPIFGQTGGYTADVAFSQEVNIRISGALGESETGGSEINIVPRTGGNRYSGNFFLSYTKEKWFDTNNGSYPGIPAAFQPVKNDHDVSLGFGGPIMHDRLWFYSVARDQGIRKLPVGVDFWPNLWEGKFGYNYQPNRDEPRVEYTNLWRNINARITWQATQKNKFNFFWDEQESCQDPCTGVVSVSSSPESWFPPRRSRTASSRRRGRTR